MVVSFTNKKKPKKKQQKKRSLYTLQLLSKRRQREAEYMTFGLCFWAVETVTLEQGNTPWVFPSCPMNLPLSTKTDGPFLATVR